MKGKREGKEEEGMQGIGERRGEEGRERGEREGCDPQQKICKSVTALNSNRFIGLYKQALHLQDPTVCCALIIHRLHYSPIGELRRVRLEWLEYVT